MKQKITPLRDTFRDEMIREVRNGFRSTTSLPQSKIWRDVWITIWDNLRFSLLSIRGD